MSRIIQAKEAAAELTPLQEAILAMLPKDGEKLAFAWLAPSVSDIRAKLNENLPAEHRVGSGAIAGSIKNLSFGGYVVPRPLGSTRGVGYQRTRAGSAKLLSLNPDQAPEQDEEEVSDAS